MKIRFPKCSRRLLAAACVAFVCSVGAMRAADGGETALLARARAFLGGEAALDAVKSLHFLGTVTAHDGKARQIEVIVRRPLQQRVVESAGDVRAITSLNDYDAWRRIERAGEAGAGRVTQLSAPDVRRLRANTWQNLYFYRHLDTVGGHVMMQGDATIDGVACRKMVFTHPGGITMERYFDQATGRLVMTKTDDGAETRESGEAKVAGVRFPKELTTTTPDGKSSRVVFDEIRVNDDFADTLFEIPRPQFSFEKPAPAEVAPSATKPVASTP